MAAAMPWRGPDADCVEAIDVRGWRGAFAHRRLAIIDLSPLGLQPMEYADAELTIVQNGEIFNYRQLRAELDGLGHTFISESDTEVLLHAFAEWGAKAVKRIEGQFAFAMWDARRQTLTLVRDRFGIKPLYYHLGPDRLVFASEVRALCASGLVPRQLNRGALDGYVATGAIECPQTAIEEVYSLPPGSMATWSQGSLSIETYWDLAECSGAWRSHPASPNDVSQLLNEAIRMELVSDVPIGAFLSGGIDSSAIVAAASEAQADLRTVSLVFDEADLDERQHSKRVAEYYGTKHTEIEISSDTAAECLPKIADFQDQPCADGLNAYLVSKAAREAGLTVALSGLGGDEIFGGYASFQLARQWSRFGKGLARMPTGVRKGLGGAASRLKGDRGGKLRRLVAEADGTEAIYSIFREVFSPGQAAALLGRPTNGQSKHGRYAEMHPVDAMTLFEHSRYMHDTTLRQADIMSMANSLEVRVPLLNHRLAERVMSVPPNQRLAGPTPKPLIVGSLHRPLPDSVVNRKKGTFTLPFDLWLRTTSRDLTQDLLLGRKARERGLFDAAEVQRTWDAFLGRQPGIGWAKIWTLAVMEAWCRKNLDGPNAF